MERGFDLGLVCFPTTGLSSSVLLIHNFDNPIRWYLLVAVVSSHLLVATTYAIGLIFALTVDDKILYGFAIYCIIFSCLWIHSARIAYQIITENIERLRKEREEMENLYDFKRNTEGKDDSFSYY